jgi:hypothetical protein
MYGEAIYGGKQGLREELKQYKPCGDNGSLV